MQISEIFLIAIPFIYAGLNRTWRGADGAPKWAWFFFMSLLALVTTYDLFFTALWTLFLVCYAVPPTHALFSSISGQPPARNDGFGFQWMRTMAHRGMADYDINQGIQGYWEKYGMVYGIFRAIPMVTFGFMTFTAYTQSPWAGMVFVFLYLGRFYYVCKNVDMAERITGFLLGIYLLGFHAVLK